MASVIIDIDLDRFDTDEIVGELVSRKQVSQEDHDRLSRWLEVTPFTKLERPRQSAGLTERWKIDFFNANKHRVTLEQLEQFFNSLPIA